MLFSRGTTTRIIRNPICCMGFGILFCVSFLLTNNLLRSFLNEKDVDITLGILGGNYDWMNLTASININNWESGQQGDDAYEDETTTTTTTRAGNKKKKLLYTVTTIAEYNNGQRKTIRGSDRFQETLIPVVTESVRNMIQEGYQVDVYLICGFVLRPQRKQLLLNALPPNIGLEVWDDAMPMNYNIKDLRNNSPEAKIEVHTRGLARQHRFVIKDKLLQYDIFVNFEDDMLIKGIHVTNYIEMSQHLLELRRQEEEEAATTTATARLGDASSSFVDDHDNNNQQHLYYGRLSASQLQHTIPGFMRVEVVLDENKTPIPPLKVKIPVDGDNHYNSYHDLAASCCHVSKAIANAKLPAKPIDHQLITWEVQIVPLGVRKMPSLNNNRTNRLLAVDHNGNTTAASANSTSAGTNTTSNSSSSSSAAGSSYNNKRNNNYKLDWVVLQRGTTSPNALADYWSGNDGYYLNDTVDWRPSTGERKYLNNQGGYMATQQQLMEWHMELCHGGNHGGGGNNRKGKRNGGGGGGFLPPFDSPMYGKWDGLDLRDVEYWSGGLQLIQATNGCNLQRIINLDTPIQFSKHILYHTTNNKQEQQQHVKERFTRLDDFYGMLTTVKKNAIHAMPLYSSSNYTSKDHYECNQKEQLRIRLKNNNNNKNKQKNGGAKSEAEADRIDKENKEGGGLCLIDSSF